MTTEMRIYAAKVLLMTNETMAGGKYLPKIFVTGNKVHFFETNARRYMDQQYFLNKERLVAEELNIAEAWYVIHNERLPQDVYDKVAWKCNQNGAMYQTGLYDDNVAAHTQLKLHTMICGDQVR